MADRGAVPVAAPDRCPRPTAAPVRAAVRRVLLVAPTALAAETSPAAPAREAAAAPEAMLEAAGLSEAVMDLTARVRALRAAADLAAWDRGAAGDDAVEAPLRATGGSAALQPRERSVPPCTEDRAAILLEFSPPARKFLLRRLAPSAPQRLS